MRPTSRKDAEAATDAIGYVENGPAGFAGHAVQECFLVAFVRIRNGYRVYADAGVTESLFKTM